MQEGEEEALDQFVEEEMRLAESELLQPSPSTYPPYRFYKNLQKVTALIVLQQEFNIEMFHFV